MSDCMAELKDAAFECLLLNPGSDFRDWQRDLVEQYTAEVVDALGCDPEAAYGAMADLWETPYYDAASGLEKNFSEWARAFSNEDAADLYYSLVEERKNRMAI